MSVQTFYIPFDEELLEVTKLKCGNIDCIYENGNLRRLKSGETEIIRMIYFAVRDENWNTAEYTIEDESININENGFEISYSSTHSLNDISYKTDVKITAKNGCILFHVKGKALASFKKNRIGLCILHPIKECAGKNATIKKIDGTVYNGIFPELISPHQPFKDIHEIKCSPADNVNLEILFAGELFETEDQRNWGDASYKTYSTPLELPFPVQINNGDTIEQTITIILTSQKETEEKPAQVEERKIRFPEISCERTYGPRLTDDELSLLRQVSFHHYRVVLYLFREDWKQELHNAIWEATNLQLKLELILVFNDDFKSQFSSFVAELKSPEGIVDSLLLLHAEQNTTPPGLFECIADEIKKQGWQVKKGYGTNGFFADLNRNRPSGIFPDFVSFGLNPQVHATDTRSILENLERQEDLVKTCNSFAGDATIFIAPITFYNSLENCSPDETLLPDKRLHGSLGALWTLHTIKSLSGAERLCFYQTKGSGGILSGTTVQSPLFNVLKAIKNFQPKWIIIDSTNIKLLQNVIFENDYGDRLEFITDKVVLF